MIKKIFQGGPNNHYSLSEAQIAEVPDKSETVSLFSFCPCFLSCALMMLLLLAICIRAMRLSHINITMPKGGEDLARSFYGKLLGLREIPKPESLRVRGGVWFDAGGLDVHASVEENRSGSDAYRHFGLECADVDAVRKRLEAAGIVTEDGRPAPWKRFFVRDPFGNRIEIHEAGGLRA